MDSFKEKLLQYVPADLAQRATFWEEKLFVAVMIFAGFFLASIIVKKLVGRATHHSDPQRQDVLEIIGGVAKLALLILGFVTAVGTLGINVSALVAGLGLTGFALGFAFKDALSNVLAGIMILMYHPFRRGEHVSMLGLAGVVASIDLRYTTLQNEGKYFLIPNSLLLVNAISVDRSPVKIQSQVPS